MNDESCLAHNMVGQTRSGLHTRTLEGFATPIFEKKVSARLGARADQRSAPNWRSSGRYATQLNLHPIPTADRQEEVRPEARLAGNIDARALYLEEDRQLCIEYN